MSRLNLLPQPDVDVLEPIGIDEPDSIQEQHEAHQPQTRPHSELAPASLKPASNGLIAAQRAIVGVVLADNTLYDRVAEYLSASDFDDPVCAAVYSSITDILEHRVDGVQVADAVSVSMQRPVRKVVGVADLIAMATQPALAPHVLEGYLNLVHNHAAERNLGNRVVLAGDLLNQDGNADSKALAIQELFNNSESLRTLPYISMGDAAVGALTDLAAVAAQGKPVMGVPYGFHDLDYLTAGMHGGQLIVLGARPSMGKTALALCIGLAASVSGVHTLMASMEMKAKELSKRAISIASGVDGQALRIAALTEIQWDNAVIASEYLSTLPFMIADIPGMKLSNLVGLARRLKREGRLGLIVVDYLQIMTPSGNTNQREQQISEISRGLKLLAMELDVPVLVLSQLSRAIESRADRRPMLSDLRESGALEQDADVVLFLHRDDMVKKIGAGTGIAEIIVGKQRAGPLGDVITAFEENTTRFHDANNPQFLRAQNLVRAQA